MMFALAIGAYGTPNAVFYWLGFYIAVNVVLNWWMYARAGAATPC
jgi:MFS transporter, NNP family, nitrate/nitrite transporter